VEGEKNQAALQELLLRVQVSKGSRLQSRQPSIFAAMSQFPTRLRITERKTKSATRCNNDHFAVNDNYRGGQVAEFLEIGQCVGIFRDVPLLKLYSFLRKILFRLVAKNSPLLRIKDDVFRHCSPPAELAPLASRR